MQPSAVQPTAQDRSYRIEIRGHAATSLHGRFSETQLTLLEALNRADLEHLGHLREMVVPEVWGETLSHTVLPQRYASSGERPTFLVIYLPGQLFGAYEFGATLDIIFRSGFELALPES